MIIANGTMGDVNGDEPLCIVHTKSKRESVYLMHEYIKQK